MKKIMIIFKLIMSFIKDAVWSGLGTAHIILSHPCKAGGLIRVSYGQLNPYLISLLSAFITLTPGTTVIEIDLERGELLLHLLDFSKRETILHNIQHDFITPLHALSGHN